MTISRRPWLLAGLVASALVVAGLGATFGLRGAAWAGDGAAVGKNQVLPYGEVNWNKGFVKVSAIGLPPFGAAGGLSPAEVARQNAVDLAQKRLLSVILDLEARDRKVRELVSSRPELKDRLRQLVSAAAVSGRSYSDGSVEITLTLPTEGSGGLKAFLGGL